MNIRVLFNNYKKIKLRKIPMEPIILFNSKEFKVGLNVYVYHSFRIHEEYDCSFIHKSCFKSKVIEINFKENWFKLKDLKQEEFYFIINDHENIQCINEYKEGCSTKFTVIPVTKNSIQNYITFKKDFIPLSKYILNVKNRCQDSFGKLHTKNLMNILRRYQQLGEYRTYIQNIEYFELKKVLSTREHIPNKKEGKVLRRSLSKGILLNSK